MSSKSKKQIKLVEKSCQITSKIINNCIKNIKNFKNEKEVESFLKKETKKNKCRLAFPSIVGFGSYAAIIHHKPSNRKLKKGFLLLDFGVRYKGYCSDITRTIYLGKPSKKERYFYNLVLKTQSASIKKLKVGVKANKIYFTAVKALGKYSKYFTHKLGHGVGRKIHEGPGLGKRNNNKLKANTTLTVEPGLYFKKKFGIRIEDTILLKKNGIKILTKVSKNLVIVN